MSDNSLSNSESASSPDAGSSPGVDKGSDVRPTAPRRAFRWLWLALAAFAYACDQLSKWWISTNMAIGEQITIIPGVLQWYHILNPGAAFSIGEGHTWLFTVIMAAAAVAIIVIARKLGSAWWAVGLGLVLGGALGNLTDRLFRPPSFGMGHVVDFISFPHFATFNMADMAVVGGVITICILTLIGIPLNGAKRGHGADQTADQTSVQDADNA